MLPYCGAGSAPVGKQHHEHRLSLKQRSRIWLSSRGVLMVFGIFGTLRTWESGRSVPTAGGQALASTAARVLVGLSTAMSPALYDVSRSPARSAAPVPVAFMRVDVSPIASAWPPSHLMQCKQLAKFRYFPTFVRRGGHGLLQGLSLQWYAQRK